MKLTNKQQADLETILYFAPKEMKAKYPPTDKDIEDFFSYSDQGKRPEDFHSGKRGFHTLLEGKRWRGIHIGMFEEGILEGSMPYMEILGGWDELVRRKYWQFWKPKSWFIAKPIPRSVVDFLKKEMFQGIDAEIIEKCYQEALSTNH